MCCVIEADNRNKGDSSQTEEQVIDLYIGIFFDGTNNNKIQVALGKRYRRDEILKEIIRKLNKGEYSREQEEFLIEKNIIGSRKIKVKRIIQQPGAMPTVAYLPVDDVTYKNFLNPRTFKSTKELIAEKYYVEYSIIKNGNVLMSVDREEWENENIKGILTQSQLDQLYYGYDKDDKDNYFIEKRISNQLDLVDHSGRIDEGSHNIGWDRNEKTEHFSFASTSKKNNENLREEIESYINENDTIKDDNQAQYYSPAQSPTYTNVAILESLYDASILFKGNDNGKKYFSIYVEGSGSDMVFKPEILGGIHVAGPDLFGLGKGTGDTGVVAKVMKMTRQIKHILQGIPNMKNIYFDIFGFSRGATEARMLTYLINPRNDIYLERKLVSTNNAYHVNDYQRFTGSPDVFLKENRIKHKEVRFLGIYDTVSSIGVFPEGLLTSNIKVGIVNDIGLKMANLDFIFNKIPDTVSRLKDNVFAWLVRLLYEKTINHPEEMAMTILTGFSPDFFTMNHRAGTEEILNQILAKFPVDQVSDQKWAIKVVEYLRDGIKSIRVNFVEPYEEYAKEQYLECMEDPNISIFGKSKYHNKNVKDYGLFATNEAQEVFHICALDEVRTNFALVDIESSVNSNGLELFIPGCHTDIGGGIGIGRDDQRIANISAFNGTPNFVCKTKPFDKKEMEYVPMSTEGLMLAGWIDTIDERVKGSYLRNVPTESELKHDVSVYTDNTNSWLHTPNIIMSRNVKPGYSNIGLHLMHGRANKEKLGRMFKDIPIAYKVPYDLQDYYNKIHGRVINTEKGRLFVNPSSGLYRELRHDWLHFSANEQIVSIADNLIVNPPYYVSVYLNDNIIPAEERIVLKGSEISFDGQKHTLRKVGNNIINLIKQPTSWLLPFPFNIKAPVQISALTDAMISSRIIYKGEEDDGFEEEKPKKTFLFDYNSTQSLIDVSLKDSKYNKDLDKYLKRLIKEIKRANHFIKMCKDVQDALSKLEQEEWFYMKVNLSKILINNIDAITPSFPAPIKIDTGEMMFHASMISFSGEMTKTNGDSKRALVKSVKPIVDGEISLKEIITPLLNYYCESLIRENGYAPEASNAFIDGYTNLRDWIEAIPQKLKSKSGFPIQEKSMKNWNKKMWAVWILMNAPEIGKLFGHTAGLIHVYRKVADWKKQEEFGHMKIRVLDKQIEMIKRDMKK